MSRHLPTRLRNHPLPHPSALDHKPPTFLRKISQLEKEKLIRLITQEHFFMKDAAHLLRMSYSTAKKILRKFKKNIRPGSPDINPLSDIPKATFKQRQQKQADSTLERIVIVSTVGGTSQNPKNVKALEETD